MVISLVTYMSSNGFAGGATASVPGAWFGDDLRMSIWTWI